MYKVFFKRFIDVLLSGMGMIILSPVYLLCLLLIPLESKGPIFFNQVRLGKNGKTFLLFKFRTMYDTERKTRGEVLLNNNEVTKIGYFLRRFKIDELPQLINIFIGDMSIVGPRPALPAQINEFNEDGKYRILVKPGLTGLAQINGNIYLTWENRWKYDRYYVQNMGFILDIKIILKTILIVILGENKFINNVN